MTQRCHSPLNGRIELPSLAKSVIFEDVVFDEVAVDELVVECSRRGGLIMHNVVREFCHYWRMLAIRRHH